MHLFLAIDRVSNCTYVELHPRADMMRGAAFVRGAVAAFPYALHTVLTDNGVAFNNCAATNPWTNGQPERMNRPVKDATVKAFHHDTLVDLAAHVAAFLTAYNFAKHLKALRWRTPFQAICDV